METGMSGNFLSCIEGVKDPFESQEGRWDISQYAHSRKGPHLMLRGESPGFSQVTAGNLVFLSSYNGDLRDPLVWPQERPVSMRVVRGFSGFLSSRCWVLRYRLETRPEPEVFSPVLTWICGFLCSLHRGVRPRLKGRHARPLPSQAVAAVSGFPSS